VKEIQAVEYPLYCLLVTLTITAVDDFAGDADWTVKFVDGPAIDTIAVPVTDARAAGTRELLLYFDPVPKPGGPPVRVDFRWRVHNSVKPLRSGPDELFINPTRAEGPIGRMDLVLQIPEQFGDVSIVPSSRPRASRDGQLMTLDELAEYEPPRGFKTIGWTGRNLAPDKLFAVDLVPHRVSIE
jgi:hypothetical protein